MSKLRSRHTVLMAILTCFFDGRTHRQCGRFDVLLEPACILSRKLDVCILRHSPEVLLALNKRKGRLSHPRLPHHIVIIYALVRWMNVTMRAGSCASAHIVFILT